MAKNELLPFANGEDANVLPTAQWQALTDILENGFQSGIARSEQVNRVLAQGAVASYVLGQLIVDQLAQDATLDESTLYQNLILALQENAKDACLPLSGGAITGNLTVQSKNVVRSINGTNADASGNVTISVPATPKAYVTETWKNGANWYRKWSDGFIEQGGESSPTSTNWGIKTITLNTAFSNTNYTIFLNRETDSSSFTDSSGQSVRGSTACAYMSKTTTSFVTQKKTMHVWYACGY